MGLLLAMPALAAAPADRSECDASADKPDVGGAACSRIIDDASAQVTDRSRPSRTGAAAPLTRRITTARLPTTARRSSSARRTPRPLRTAAKPTNAKRTTPPPLPIAPRRSDRPEIWLGHNNRGVAYYGLHEYDAALADHAEAIRVDFQGIVGLCPPRHGEDRKG